MSKIEELIDDVANAGGELATCFEWGEGIKNAEKELEDAKKALKEYVDGLWSEVELKEGVGVVYLAVHVVTWKDHMGKPAIGFVRSYESEDE